MKLNLIAKQSKGRSFRGLLNYLLSKEGAEIVGGNMIGDNARELAAEFSASRKLRPSLNRVVYHSSLSLPPGESLSDQKWRDISQQYVSKMGFKSSQYVAVKHTDTEHPHIHIVASRISMDGRVVSDSHDFKRSESIVRGIERDYGLTPVAPSREAQAKAPKTGELHKALRENDPSAKMVLKHAIDQARSNRPTMSEFILRLDVIGVSVIPNIAKTGTITGLSFEIGGEKMKGSDIGRGYTWQGLQKKGVNYEQRRDFRSISATKDRPGNAGRDAGGIGRILSGQVGRSEGSIWRNKSSSQGAREFVEDRYSRRKSNDVGGNKNPRADKIDEIRGSRFSQEFLRGFEDFGSGGTPRDAESDNVCSRTQRGRSASSGGSRRNQKIHTGHGENSLSNNGSSGRYKGIQHDSSQRGDSEPRGANVSMDNDHINSVGKHFDVSDVSTKLKKEKTSKAFDGPKKSKTRKKEIDIDFSGF